VPSSPCSGNISVSSILILPTRAAGSNKKAKNNEAVASRSDLEERRKEAISSLVSKAAQILSDAFTLGIVKTPSLQEAGAELVTDSINWLDETYSGEKGKESAMTQGLKEHWAKYVQRVSQIEVEVR
jgi:hypothetical protein